LTNTNNDAINFSKRRFMAKIKGINRAYEKDLEKSPQEKQQELDELMQKFLAKGGVIEKCPPMEPTKEQLKSWKI
jgi:hypothetical protein